MAEASSSEIAPGGVVNRKKKRITFEDTLLGKTGEEEETSWWKFFNDQYGPLPTLPEEPWTSWPGMIISEILKNWKSGVTVALVSVPLSISLALAAQASPVMGIITAIWAGAATSILGGSDFNICGPTGALSGILSVYAVQYGVGVLPLLALVAGVMTLIVAIFRLDIYVMFIPSAVMEGFSVAVAVIIGCNQLRMGFGLPRDVPTHPEFIFNLGETLTNLHRFDGLTLGTFLVGTALLLFLVTKLPKVPWSVILAVIAIALGYAAANGHMIMYKHVQTLQTRYGELEPKVFDFKFPEIPKPRDIYQTQREAIWDVLYASLSVAFVAVLETLISARIADRMTNTKFAQPREVFGGAVANILCGLFGGVPATAALARTALNIKTGATSRMSGVISAIGISVISLVLLNWFKFLLLPIVAAILVVTAVRMVEAKQLYHMYLFDRKMFWVAVFTALVCIIRDPTDGIIAGGIVSLFMYAKANSRAYGEVEVAVSRELRITNTRSTSDVDAETAEKELKKVQSSFKRIQDLAKGLTGQGQQDERAAELEEIPGDLEAGAPHEDTLIYKFPSELTYLNSPAHIDRAKELHKQYSYVILVLRSLYYLDVDGLDALNEIVEEFDRYDKLVLVAAVRKDIAAQLKYSKWYEIKFAAGQVLPSEHDCLKFIVNWEKQQALKDLEGETGVDVSEVEAQSRVVNQEIVSSPSVGAVSAVDHQVKPSSSAAPSKREKGKEKEHVEEEEPLEEPESLDGDNGAGAIPPSSVAAADAAAAQAAADDAVAPESQPKIEEVKAEPNQPASAAPVMEDIKPAEAQQPAVGAAAPAQEPPASAAPLHIAEDEEIV